MRTILFVPQTFKHESRIFLFFSHTDWIKRKKQRSRIARKIEFFSGERKTIWSRMSVEIRIFVSTTPGSLERKKMIERTVNVIKGLASRMDYTVGKDSNDSSILFIFYSSRGVPTLYSREINYNWTVFNCISCTKVASRKNPIFKKVFILFFPSSFLIKLYAFSLVLLLLKSSSDSHTFLFFSILVRSDGRTDGHTLS